MGKTRLDVELKEYDATCGQIHVPENVSCVTRVESGRPFHWNPSTLSRSSKNVRQTNQAEGRNVSTLCDTPW